MDLIFLLIVTFFLLVSAGFFIFQLLEIEEKNIFSAMWMGMLPIGLLATIVNFFFPLQSYLSLICIIPSIFGIPKCITCFRLWLTYPLITRISNSVFTLILLTLALVLVSTSHVTLSSDTGGYHLQIVAWAKEFPTTMGIGNLETRLANNSMWYTLAALVPLEISEVPVLMTALFFIGVIGWTFSHLAFVKTIWEKTFFLCIAALSVGYVKYWLFINLYSDKIALFFAIIALYEILKIHTYQNINIYQRITMTILFLSLGFSTKPLVIIPLLLGICLSIYIYYKKQISTKDILKTYTIPILLGIAWCTKNIIVTGYPIFPMTLLAMPVDWLIPIEYVDGFRIDILGWARWPRAGYSEALAAGVFYWFPSWLDALLSSKSQLLVFVLPLLTSVAVWGIVFCNKNYNFNTLFVLAYSIMPLTYWFLMYPDTRFGEEFAWISLAASCSICVKQKNIFQPLLSFISHAFKYVPFASILLLVFILITKRDEIGKMKWESTKWPVPQIEQVTIGKDFPSEKFEVWIPILRNNQCGISPLPCVFNVNEKLRMRKQNDLSQGFNIAK